MGIAIIAKGADFGANNLGTVTPVTTVELSSLTIDGPSAVENLAQFVAVYSPANTTQKGVTWSITSGSQYASIDSNGLLTVEEGADNDNVTIKIVSRVNPSISATKTVAVTFKTVQYGFNDLLTFNQTSWRNNAADGGIDNPIPGETQAYYYLHANDNTKIGQSITAVKGTGTGQAGFFGAYQVFKIPVPDGATSVEIFPIKTSQTSGYAYVDNNDIITGFIFNTTVNSGTAATYSIPAGTKYIYMPLSPSVYTNTNSGANLTVTFS